MKSKLLLSALMLTGASLASQAQVGVPEGGPEAQIYWSFNSTPEEVPSYDAEFYLYKGTYNVPASEKVSFYVDYYGTKLVPGTVSITDESNDVTINPNGEIVVFDNGFFSGSMAPDYDSETITATQWYIENWKGGQIEVTLDIDNYQILLSVVEEGDVPGTPAEYDLVLAGNFNDYAVSDPTGVWSLPYFDTDIYRGTFNIPASDQIDFYISRLGGNMVLVPGVVADGDVEPSEESVTIELEDGFYSGSFAQTSLSNSKWVIENWAGGDIEVTVDYTEMTIVLSVVESEEPGTPAQYDLVLAGNFNDYAVSDPTGVWSLPYFDTDIYRGTFNIPASDQIDFYISRLGGNMVLVPGVVADGDVEPSEESVTIELEDGFYSGSFAQTSLSNSKWVIENWAGGDIEVTVDYTEMTILLSVVTEGTPEVEPNLFIAGSFNEYAPEGLETWALAATDAEGVYRGTFDIPASNKVDFYFNYNSMALVPAVVNGEEVELAGDVTVVWDEDFFSGALTSTGVANGKWVIENWDGGAIEVTVDLMNNEIVLSKAVEDTPVIGENVFIAGSFNEYAPEGLAIWALTATEAEGVYRGTFDIAASDKVDFYIDYNSIALVPAVVNSEEEVEPAAEDVTVVWDVDFFSGALTSTGVANSKWVIENWDGGAIEVTVDLMNNEIVLSKAVEDTPVIGENVFIAGSFNEYAPEGLAIWALTATEAEGVYRGTFDIAASDKVDFYIDYNSIALVPAVVNSEEEVEPAAEDVTVVWDEDFFSGALTSTGVANSKWVIENWDGGAIEVTIDLLNNEIALSKAVEDTPVIGENVFISGNFNEYAPEGLAIWALTATEAEGVYRGTFNNIAAGEVSFHIDYNGISLVPGVKVEEEVEVADENAEVVFDEDGFFSGLLASTGVANTNWVISEWDASTLEVTVDLLNGEILLSKVMDEEPGLGYDLFISGNFNDYAPEGLEIWSLGATEEEGVYRGTFVEIPEGEVSFHLDYNGISLVPGVDNEGEVAATEGNVNVVWDEDLYTSAFATTGVAKTNWVISNWDGMALEVTVDFNEGTILLSKITEITPEAGNLYIAGNFNDYAPEGLEIWSLGVDENGEVFQGEFNLPEGELSFYFLYETIAIVPGVEEDGDVVAATENVEIFDGSASYSGMTAYSGLANVCWTDANWEGGVLYVTVDLNNNKVSFSKEGTTGIESIGEAELNNGAIYNLQGVRVDANKLTKGIYIINGKKVLVK